MKPPQELMNHPKGRSFSEGHIDVIRLPRIPSTLQLLLEDVGTPPTPDPPLQIGSPELHGESILSFLHRWTLRFSVHLSLVALFETLFFWQFVSRTEDTALIKLVNSYSNGLLGRCNTMNESQKIIFMDIVTLFVNQTQVQSKGSSAAVSRAAYNGSLLITSWVYVGTLIGLSATLTGSAIYRRLPIQWQQMVFENITLILILGLYEFMFFSTVVYPYESISMPELDRMLLNEIDANCSP